MPKTFCKMFEALVNQKLAFMCKRCLNHHRLIEFVTHTFTYTFSSNLYSLNTIY